MDATIFQFTLPSGVRVGVQVLPTSITDGFTLAAMRSADGNPLEGARVAALQVERTALVSLRGQKVGEDGNTGETLLAQLTRRKDREVYAKICRRLHDLTQTESFALVASRRPAEFPDTWAFDLPRSMGDTIARRDAEAAHLAAHEEAVAIAEAAGTPAPLFVPLEEPAPLQLVVREVGVDEAQDVADTVAKSGSLDPVQIFYAERVALFGLAFVSGPPLTDPRTRKALELAYGAVNDVSAAEVAETFASATRA